MISSLTPVGEPEPDEDRVHGLSESIARLRRAMRRAARVADPDNTLTVAQLELLASLAEHPGARPSELARLLRLAPSTVTTLINAIAPRGLISRNTEDSDRRAVAMDLTDAGHGALDSWQLTNTAILATAMAALPASQQRALIRAVPALDALALAIDALAEPTAHPGAGTRPEAGSHLGVAARPSSAREPGS